MKYATPSTDFCRGPAVVNVASVPQRSPFRYPGGKTWLIPYIRRWFHHLTAKPALLVEPFAGGGIVSLTAAFEDLADRVLMVELDAGVASVWRAALYGERDWLADRILNFALTKESVVAELSRPPASLRAAAFQTILRNRTNHGGIMAPGAGLIHSGENGRGIGSRWYPETISKRIRDLGQVKHRIDFIQGDGLAALRQYAPRENAVFFIDPPYTAAGKRAGTRLYTHNAIDHAELFRLVSGLRGDFLMTYDNSPELRAMAAQHGFDYAAIPMKNTHNTRMTELLIGRELSWAK